MVAAGAALAVLAPAPPPAAAAAAAAATAGPPTGAPPLPTAPRGGERATTHPPPPQCDRNDGRNWRCKEPAVAGGRRCAEDGGGEVFARRCASGHTAGTYVIQWEHDIVSDQNAVGLYKLNPVDPKRLKPPGDPTLKCDFLVFQLSFFFCKVCTATTRPTITSRNTPRTGTSSGPAL
jgi:hypothetical protein